MSRDASLHGCHGARRLRAMAVLVFCLLLAASTARAADNEPQSGEPRLLGTFSGWSAYKMTDQGADVCYMVTQTGHAARTGGSGKKPARGKTYLMVTERPIERSFDVVSYAAGASLLKNAPVTLTIDGKNFSLFADGSFAWTHDSSADRKLTAALRAGRLAKIDAETAKKKKLHDDYPLKGASAAYKAIATACGMAEQGQDSRPEAH